VTYAQLKTRIARICGLGDSGDDSADDWAMLGEVVNEAVVDILSRTRLNVKCLDISLTIGEREYDFGGSILAMHNIKRTPAALDTSELQEVAAGDIHRVGTGHYAIAGYNRLIIGWDPETGDELEAWYTPKPTPMTADGDDPSASNFGNIPSQFHDAIVEYGCWKMSDMAGDQASGRGEKYRIAYEGKNGTGELGSALGRIKFQTNRRAMSGSRQRRLTRFGSSDGSPPGRDDFYRG
jgi:hypothetical protein